MSIIISTFTWISYFFTRKNIFFSIKTDCSLIDFYVFFSDAIIGIYKITELRKYIEKKIFIYLYILHKNILWIWNILFSDSSELDLFDETIRIPIFHFSRKLWWKNCWKLPKLLRFRKTHIFQTITDIDSQF